MEKRKFYLVDTESENYFVGVVHRTQDQVKDFMWKLEVGETHWSDERRGFERAE